MRDDAIIDSTNLDVRFSNMPSGFDESGLHQNWMRDYDPTTGRYIQADPLGLVDGASVYGYALQNPGRYVDPRGEDSTTGGSSFPFPIPAPQWPWEDYPGQMGESLINFIISCFKEDEGEWGNKKCKLVGSRTGITEDGPETHCVYECPDGSSRTTIIPIYGARCAPTIPY